METINSIDLLDSLNTYRYNGSPFTSQNIQRDKRFS
jgi:hypothetical protein